jgi:hypothetical protein
VQRSLVQAATSSTQQQRAHTPWPQQPHHQQQQHISSRAPAAAPGCTQSTCRTYTAPHRSQPSLPLRRRRLAAVSASLEPPPPASATPLPLLLSVLPALRVTAGLWMGQQQRLGCLTLRILSLCWSLVRV